MNFAKPALIAGAIFVTTCPAWAELIVCNKTSFKQGVSIGYNSGNNWVSEGWWNIEPGACASVVEGDLKNQFYYYRAEINGGDFVGEDYMFCTTPAVFTIVGDENCAARGYDRENFAEIDTGPTNTKYTLTLVP